MSLDSKSLAPAQEQDIARKLGNAARLTPQAFAEKAITQPFFCRWYRPRYQAEPVLEKITDAVRAAYMVAWEAELRTEYARDNERNAPPSYDGEAADPYDSLPMTRAGAVPHARENEDAIALGDDDGGDGDDDDDDDDGGEYIGRDPAPYVAPPLGNSEPAHVGPPITLSDGRVVAGGVFYASAADYAAHLAECEEAEAEFDERAAAIVNRLRASGLSNAGGNNEQPYLLQAVIPLKGATMFHGLRKHGKSSLAHKLVVCITSDGLDFDGVAVPHGRVLYVSADNGATREDVARRLYKICYRLGVPMPDDDRLQVLDETMDLTDPAEVDTFLANNPGPWALVVIDPLYRCVGNGDVAQTPVSNAAESGLRRIGDVTGAPVLVIHHDRKDGGASYGATFMEAGYVGATQFVRQSKGNVLRDGDRVTATVEFLKSGFVPDKPFEYFIEGAYLATAAERGHAGESAHAANASPAPKNRPEVLALLATTTATTNGLLAVLNAKLLLAGKPQIEERTFQRLCHEWREAGLVEYDGKRRTIRRKA